MDRINFYNAMLPKPHLALFSPSLDHESSYPFRDQFLKSSSPFLENRLLTMVKEIKTHEDELNHRAKLASSEADKKELTEHFRVIADTKKWLGMLIDNLQKALQTISANFR